MLPLQVLLALQQQLQQLQQQQLQQLQQHGSLNDALMAILLSSFTAGLGDNLRLPSLSMADLAQAAILANASAQLSGLASLAGAHPQLNAANASNILQLLAQTNSQTNAAQALTQDMTRWLMTQQSAGAHEVAGVGNTHPSVGMEADARYNAESTATTADHAAGLPSSFHSPQRPLQLQPANMNDALSLSSSSSSTSPLSRTDRNQQRNQSALIPPDTPGAIRNQGDLPHCRTSPTNIAQSKPGVHSIQPDDSAPSQMGQYSAPANTHPPSDSHRASTPAIPDQQSSTSHPEPAPGSAVAQSFSRARNQEENTVATLLCNIHTKLLEQQQQQQEQPAMPSTTSARASESACQQQQAGGRNDQLQQQRNASSSPLAAHLDGHLRNILSQYPRLTSFLASNAQEQPSPQVTRSSPIPPDSKNQSSTSHSSTNTPSTSQPITPSAVPSSIFAKANQDIKAPAQGPPPQTEKHQQGVSEGAVERTQKRRMPSQIVSFPQSGTRDVPTVGGSAAAEAPAEPPASKRQRRSPSLPQPVVGSEPKHGFIIHAKYKPLQSSWSLLFPWRLHDLLDEYSVKVQHTDPFTEAANNPDPIVSWEPDGSSFRVHDKQRFVANVIGKAFPPQLQIATWEDFVDALSRWGFVYFKSGPHADTFIHRLFSRAKRHRCKQMRIHGRTVAELAKDHTHFVVRLHEMLRYAERNDLRDVACWDSPGESFMIHDFPKFLTQVYGTFSDPIRESSFIQKLQRWGFVRSPGKIRVGQYVVPSYSHPFLRRDELPRVTWATSSDQLLGMAVKANHDFLTCLRIMLNEASAVGHGLIASWSHHGKAFLIHDRPTFVSTIMPRYFRMKFASFRHALRDHGFAQMGGTSWDEGAHYHNLFTRDDASLCWGLTQEQMKDRMPSWTPVADEPDFYDNPPNLSRHLAAPPIPPTAGQDRSALAQPHSNLAIPAEPTSRSALTPMSHAPPTAQSVAASLQSSELNNDDAVSPPVAAATCETHRTATSGNTATKEYAVTGIDVTVGTRNTKNEGKTDCSSLNTNGSSSDDSEMERCFKSGVDDEDDSIPTRIGEGIALAKHEPPFRTKP